MDIQLVLLLTFIGSVLAILLAFIWVAVRLGPKGRGHGGGHGENSGLFDDDFRRKLQERGMIRFEQTIDQNAAFLQQDLRKMSDDISDFIKEQAASIIKDEFSDQKQAVAAAQEHMAEDFAKVDRAIQQYQTALVEQLQKEILHEKQRRLNHFSQNMAEVVTAHVEDTLATHMSLDDQVKYILKNLEENKDAIVEDIKREF